MGAWTHEELEREFEAYQARGAAGDWSAWADQFTEDATYVEHHYGRFEGREAIRAWITETMGSFPGSEMHDFPVGWYVVDDERGWIVCEVFNRMRDPGDGSIHEAPNITILHYAGDGRWSYEEDAYNPANMGAMVQGWMARCRELEGGAPPRPPAAGLRARREAAVAEHMASENDLDFDRTIATFARPRYELMATGQVFEGEAEVRGYFAASRSAFPDQRNESVVLSHLDDGVLAEFDLLGTHLGPFAGHEPTGRTFRTRMAALFLFDPGGDGIVCERVYFDSSSILRQLGLQP